jgi:hypothetical protein
MIRLGLRLAFTGREALIRLAVTAVAVALGAGMLLTTLAGLNAVNAQNARYTWLNAEPGPQTPAIPTESSDSDQATAQQPVWWLLAGDNFDGKLIGRIDLAATGPRSVVPPGIPRVPAAGEFYVSPAMVKLLARTPAGQLSARFPGNQIGIIGRDALPSPDSLIIVIGRHATDLAAQGRASQITDFTTGTPGNCGCYVIGIDTNGIKLVFGVIAAALLFPVLVFIGTATRLSAARREQRFAAMRLVGATPRQVSVVSAVESVVAAVFGMLAGFLLFFAARGLIARIPFTGSRFFSSDLSLTPLNVLLVAIGVPIAAEIAARLALRRVHISPLGVSRRVRPKPPSANRLIPLAAGIAELGYFFVVGRPATSTGQLYAYLAGILLVMFGLVIAGPFITMLGSRLMAKRTGRPAILLAGRRLSDDPQMAFRAISGVILAMFVATVSVSVIGTIVANEGPQPAGSEASRVLVDDFTGPIAPAGGPDLPAASPALLTSLRDIPGVRAVLTIRKDPQSPADDPSGGLGLTSCRELKAIPELGQCPAGVAIVRISPYLAAFIGRHHAGDGSVSPAGDITTADLEALPLATVYVSTDGSQSAIEKARTSLENAYPFQRKAPETFSEQDAEHTEQLSQYQQLAEVVILASIPIAGCSLAVSVVGGLNDRKRPFSLLRLAGTPVGVLRRVVAVETALPLVLGAVLATAVGLLAAHLFLKSQLDYSLQPPTPAFYLVVLAGLVTAMGIVALTLPVLSRTTGPETARND